MGCCDAPDLMPLEDATRLLRQQISPIEGTEVIDLDQADNRILAKNISAPISVPGFDNSAMDGYAVKFSDLERSAVFEVSGKSFAGAGFVGRVGKGQCIRIMTGAPLPQGTDTVVMQEDALAEGNRIKFLHPNGVKQGQHIRRQGADIALGQTLLHKGKRLGPTDIGLIASLGIEQVTVMRPLKVALLSTGDELQMPGTPLAAGHIYDSNRFVLKAMLCRLGVELLDLGIVPDEPSALEDAFTLAAETCDLIFSSGGVSVGEADYTRNILERMGDISFWKIAIKPGKPLAFGRLGKAFFFGLPGNPVSAALTFHQVALPALQLLAGEKVAPSTKLQAQVKGRIRKRPGRTDFQRGLITSTATGLEVKVGDEQSSGVLSSFTDANCYIKLGQFSCDQEDGDMVEVIPFDRWIV